MTRANDQKTTKTHLVWEQTKCLVVSMLLLEQYGAVKPTVGKTSL